MREPADGSSTVKAAISGTETVTITEADDDGNKGVGVKKYDVPVADPNGGLTTWPRPTVTVAEQSPNTGPDVHGYAVGRPRTRLRWNSAWATR